MSLRSKVIKLARQNPELRDDLLTVLAALRCVSLSGGARAKYKDAIWEMYETTYRSIGLHVRSPEEMMSKYKVWEVCLNKEGKPAQFSLFKPTPFGLKSGLSGHDGSPEGKSHAKAMIRSKFKQPGYYGEVSHKVEAMAVAAGTPAICAAYVDDITGKRIEGLSDGLHYKRNLGPVGTVTKMMVGRPKGVPVTDPTRPSCPLGDPMRIPLPRSASDEECDYCDIDSHLACMALDLD